MKGQPKKVVSTNPSPAGMTICERRHIHGGGCSEECTFEEDGKCVLEE